MSTTNPPNKDQAANPENSDQSKTALRNRVREHYLCNETDAIKFLLNQTSLSISDRTKITERAQQLVTAVRANSDPQIMESFLGEYGLSSEEGIALMCLAEALLRVPDSETVDALIQDKIVPADWGQHLGKSSSSLVNASTWALMLTGKIIADEPDGIAGALQGAVRRLGEPVIRTAVSQAIRELGNQFVLGETIDRAITKSTTATDRGYTYSYDMLGEAARTEADAKRYHLSYSDAISTLSTICSGNSVSTNPGISVKLSALFPRYEYAQKERAMIELVARTRSLAMLAKSANMGFNIDAEEADRLDLSLDIIEAVLSEPSLAEWDGFGIVVQAYSPRAWYVIDYLYNMAQRLDRKVMVRLVKGAYWDSEIKRAQVLGLDGFPVFTRKSNTDISYIACAEKLLGMTDRIYPQFATHNAHTVAAVSQMASDTTSFEFQRLHGMGDALHDHVLKTHGSRCRIYAPVGAHEDLLAYLVRRLLENGANSSFVNQIVDETVSVDEIAADPMASVDADTISVSHPSILHPSTIYGLERTNSQGVDLTDPLVIENLDADIQQFETSRWTTTPLVPGAEHLICDPPRQLTNPARRDDIVGIVTEATSEHVNIAFQNAIEAETDWQKLGATERGHILLRTSELFEQHRTEFIALATREAGKTIPDGVAEVREAVDFLRYYPAKARELMDDNNISAHGVFICISPWNFPLAIFTGQIAAALATGNTVIAKPAEQTPLIATRAIELFHQAGVPASVLQLLPGSGSSVGAQLVADPRAAGVCFTGSTATARTINQSLATHGNPAAPLIAETGGLNAMIVDSTSLPEQAVADILASAFQSAGQRCSALRVLFLQDDIHQRVVNMLSGAMDLLAIGDPRLLSTDVGPVIDQQALDTISQHCRQLEERGRLIHKISLTAACETGSYIAPAVYQLDNINELHEEIFGPILHIVNFAAEDFYSVLDAINNTGYGLTFGLHTRVDERVQDVVDGIDAGNLYINRNQIGAIVGSQPFGGKGLSGTGPKAGGPHYLLRFLRFAHKEPSAETKDCVVLDSNKLQRAITELNAPVKTLVASPRHLHELLQKPVLSTLVNESIIQAAMHFVDVSYHTTIDLPGPTGESNRLGMHPVGTVLCLQASSPAYWLAQIIQSLATGNRVLAIGQDAAVAQTLLQTDETLPLVVIEAQIAADAVSGIDIDAVATPDTNPLLRDIRQALAMKSGPIVPVCTDIFDLSPLVSEQALCVDTTASGGNASLLALVD